MKQHFLSSNQIPYFPSSYPISFYISRHRALISFVFSSIMPGSPNHFGGSSASCSNPLFFSIVSGFLLSFLSSRPDFLCFLQHRARIPQSFWRLFSIVPESPIFHHHVQFPFIFPGNAPRFPFFSPTLCSDPLVISATLRHRARIPCFPTSCPVSFYLSQYRARISFVFSSIVPRSPSHSGGSSTSCPDPIVIPTALRHRARIPYFPASCLVSFYLSRQPARILFIFSGTVFRFLQLSSVVCLGPLVLRSSWLIPLASLWLCGDKIVGHLNSSLDFISLIDCFHFAFVTHSFIHSTEEGHICRPSILSLDTCILSYGCHMHPCFHMTSS